MKKIISTMLLLIMMCTAIIAMPSEVEASEITEESQEKESLFTEDEESNAVVYAYLASTLRGVYMLKGTATITKPFTGIAGCAGSTTANFAVSTIAVTVVLERYVNGSWVSVKGWTAVKYNDYYVSSYNTQAVTSGYYYRVQTSHIAQSETTMTATSGIWFA